MTIDILIHRLNMIYAHAGKVNVYGNGGDYEPNSVVPEWVNHSYWINNGTKWHVDEYRGVHL